MILPASDTLQIHSNRHTIAMHQKTRRQPLTQHLQITNELDALRLTLPRPLDRTRQRSEHHGRIIRILTYELVENEMLGATWEVVEGERDRGLEGKARGL
jgi:hypothetical protein